VRALRRRRLGWPGAAVVGRPPPHDPVPAIFGFTR